MEELRLIERVGRILEMSNKKVEQTPFVKLIEMMCDKHEADVLDRKEEPYWDFE